MKTLYKSLWIWCCFISLIIFSCKTDKQESPTPSAPIKKVSIPRFEGNTAYQLIEKQLSFGTRVPGSEGHQACKEWMVGHLEGLGLKVIQQNFKASFLGLVDQPSTNIIASYKPELSNRIMLAAHWDTRLIAEKDEDEAKRKEAIMGADDGASGTAVLLHIAELISKNELYIGVDLVFFDAEDNGDDGENWCLGSQYWSKNIHVDNYKPKFGILLDMIGAKGAQFGYEGYSQKYAKHILDKTWKLAKGMGKGDLFVSKATGPIQDDHYYVNAVAGIPMIDIINRPMKTESGFAHYHHTHDDDINIIDQNVLSSVGQVVTAVIYKSSNGSF